jgi:hypothetical protein
MNSPENKMRSFVKVLIPPKLRFFMRVLWIGVSDLITGTRFKFAKNSPEDLERAQTWPERITIKQPINVRESSFLSQPDLFLLASCGESDKKSRL